jgi:sporulation protein YtfJ
MKENHPIEGLMLTTMSSIHDMIDVNTIIGEPIESSDGMTIIPISKVSFGFAAGGSEFNTESINEYSKKEKEELIQYRLPFGGGAGAGASISPVAFLIIQNGTTKLLPVEHASCVDRLMDYVPDLMEKMNEMFNKKVQNQNEKTEKIIEEIKKNTKKYQTKPEFKEKDFETKTSEDFKLKDDISTDVKEEINYEIKRQEEESDGEDF